MSAADGAQAPEKRDPGTPSYEPVSAVYVSPTAPRPSYDSPTAPGAGAGADGASGFGELLRAGGKRGRHEEAAGREEKRARGANDASADESEKDEVSPWAAKIKSAMDGVIEADQKVVRTYYDLFQEVKDWGERVLTRCRATERKHRALIRSYNSSRTVAGRADFTRQELADVERLHRAIPCIPDIPICPCGDLADGDAPGCENLECCPFSTPDDVRDGISYENAGDVKYHIGDMRIAFRSAVRRFREKYPDPEIPIFPDAPAAVRLANYDEKYDDDA